LTPYNSTRKFYEENAQQVFDRTNGIEISNEYYAPFLEQIPAGGSILDAGCGSGRDSRHFLSLGYQVTAMDASIELCRLAAIHTGQPVLNLAFEDMDFSASFDGVWASASLLHVALADFSGVLDRIHRALKPGGILYASFIYGRGETQRGNLHFTDFDEETFAAQLEACPILVPLNIWKTPDLPPARPGRFWLNVLAQTSV
jgi:2-polyprenyl-3-methyl-5-hydroxy-6-metoxy-1,4-benzoquinol methylase